jgi:cytochrome c-type biogenesis protein CcmE
MDKRRIKFLFLGLGIIASMGLLLKAGIVQSGGLSYYLTVDEYHEKLVNDDLSASENYRVNGKVEEGSIVRLESGLDVRFQVTDGTVGIPVAYHGIVPDTFVDNADVVVEGNMDDNGTFVAHTMLAKCPSKYESADGAEDMTAAYEN